MSLPDLFSLHPEHLAVHCDAATAESLLAYDKHLVTINGREGMLLSYHLEGQPLHPKDNRVYIVFQHVDAHPKAPAEIQDIVARLSESVL